MTIQQALARIDELKPNPVSATDKIRWLSQLDAMILNEIIKTHYLSDEEREDYLSRNVQYNDDSDLDTELLAAFPYDDIYIKWLEAQIDYYNGEVRRYSNSLTMFNSAWTQYANWFNSRHMPIGFRYRYF